jgi:Rrf2 family protein
LAAAEIAEKYDISLHHLAKVLRDLGRAGIVDAARGAGGGYRFSGNPKRLTLMDVIELFEPIAPDRTSGDDPRPTTEIGRAMRLILNEIDEHAVATFRSITISTVLKIVDQRPWMSAVANKKQRKRAARG